MPCILPTCLLCTFYIIYIYLRLIGSVNYVITNHHAFSLLKSMCFLVSRKVWNGPMGVFEFERFAVGTLGVAKCLAGLTEKGAITIIGGGDSVRIH